MFGRGAARGREIFPQAVLSMSNMPKVVGQRRFLLERQHLLLHRRLSEIVRHKMCGLQAIRRRRGGVDDGQHVPSEMLHVQPMQSSVPIGQQGECESTDWNSERGNDCLLRLQVTNTGKEVICEQCVAIPADAKVHSSVAPQSGSSPPKDLNVSNSPTRATAQQHNQNGGVVRGQTTVEGNNDPNACAGCNEQLKEGQALIALDRQWHICCFK